MENVVQNGHSEEFEENENSKEAGELVVDSTENPAENKSKKKKKNKKKAPKSESNEQEGDIKAQTADEINKDKGAEVEDEGMNITIFVKFKTE